MTEIALKKRPLLEALAVLEHQQWMEWSQNVAETEVLCPIRLKRWMDCWKPYDQLTEEQKNQDRKWAIRILGLLECYKDMSGKATRT